MDGLVGLVVAVDGLGRQFWPASSLHGLTSLFLPLIAVSFLPLIAVLFLPLIAVFLDLLDHVDGPVADLVGLPSIDGLSASAGL